MDENKAKEEQTKVSEETNKVVDNNEETTKIVEETETEEEQNEERNSEDDFWGETPRNKKPTKQILVGVIAIALVFACIAGVASCSGMVAHPTNTPSPTPTVIPSASPTPKPTSSAKTEQKKEEKKEDKKDTSAKKDEKQEDKKDDKKDTSAKKEEPKKETTVSVNNGKKQQNAPAKAPAKQPATPQHVHHWQPVYTTVHHDAQYTTVHHDAVTQNQWVVDQPERRGVIVCGCGAQFNSIQEWSDHDDQFILQGDVFGHGSYSVQSFPEVGHNETVIVSPAYDEQVQSAAPYDEQVLSGYRCSCGATK